MSNDAADDDVDADGYEFYGDDVERRPGDARVDDMDDEDARQDDDDDDFEREFAPASAYARVKHAWMRERLAPEILSYIDDDARELKRAIDAQEQRLEREQAREGKDQATEICLNAMWTELHRAKYVLREYLRTRLRKIEKYAMFIALDDEDERGSWARLSEAEQRYVTNYLAAVTEHSRSVLDGLPENYRDLIKEHDDNDEMSQAELRESKMVSKPNLDAAVFFRFREDVGNFLLDENAAEDGERSIELRRGQILLAKYSMFKELLETEPPKAELV